MNVPIDNFIAVILSGFGILLSLFVGIQVLNRKSGIKQANTFLGLMLLLYSLTLLNGLMAMTGLYATYQYLYFLPLTFSFSIGPLFYFFIKSRVQPSFIFKRKHLVHFILPAFQFAFYLSIGFRSAEFKSRIWRFVIAPYGQYVEESLTIVLGTGYLVASILILNKQIPKKLWNHPVCQWLKKFSVALLVLLSISFAYEIADWILWNGFEYNLYNTPWADFPLKLSYAMISLFIGFNAFIYQNQSLITPQYFDSGNEASIERQIEALLATHQVHLDPELKLENLAKMLNLSKNKLSAYFSSRGESFRAFINKRRIEHFETLVQQGKQKQLSLLGLAYESGFNSKASFNRVFKELRGKTPREFIQAA